MTVLLLLPQPRLRRLGSGVHSVTTSVSYSPPCPLLLLYVDGLVHVSKLMLVHYVLL
jgi:hypothetical protein